LFLVSYCAIIAQNNNNGTNKVPQKSYLSSHISPVISRIVREKRDQNKVNDSARLEIGLNYTMHSSLIVPAGLAAGIVAGYGSSLALSMIGAAINTSEAPIKLALGIASLSGLGFTFLNRSSLYKSWSKSVLSGMMNATFIASFLLTMPSDVENLASIGYFSGRLDYLNVLHMVPTLATSIGCVMGLFYAKQYLNKYLKNVYKNMKTKYGLLSSDEILINDASEVLMSQVSFINGGNAPISERNNHADNVINKCLGTNNKKYSAALKEFDSWNYSSVCFFSFSKSIKSFLSSFFTRSSGKKSNITSIDSHYDAVTKRMIKSIKQQQNINKIYSYVANLRHGLYSTLVYTVGASIGTLGLYSAIMSRNYSAIMACTLGVGVGYSYIKNHLRKFYKNLLIQYNYVSKAQIKRNNATTFLSSQISYLNNSKIPLDTRTAHAKIILDEFLGKDTDRYYKALDTIKLNNKPLSIAVVELLSDYVFSNIGFVSGLYLSNQAGLLALQGSTFASIGQFIAASIITTVCWKIGYHVPVMLANGMNQVFINLDDYINRYLYKLLHGDDYTPQVGAQRDAGIASDSDLKQMLQFSYDSKRSDIKEDGDDNNLSVLSKGKVT